MAATQQRSDKLLAALDSAIPRHRYKTTIGVKTKGRGFARPTKASTLKQVMQAPLMDSAKCESVVMLKNLAKVLVDRIEAACAARNQPPVPNPKRYLNTASQSHLQHGPNLGRSVIQEVGNLRECESGLDVDELCAVATDKDHSPSLSTKQCTRQLVDDRSRQCIPESNRSCETPNRGSSGSSICESSEPCRPNDSRLSSQSNPCGSTWESCRPHDSRPSSQPNLSGGTSETFAGLDSRPSSRTPSREWTGTPVRKVSSLRSRMLTLKKVNVGLDDLEIKPPTKGVHSTSGRKMWSPGLRSLVVAQVKNLPTPPRRPHGISKLVQSSSSSKPLQKGVKNNVESALKEAENSEQEEPNEAVWADVVQNVFDEVFGDSGKQPSHVANKKHQNNLVSGPPHESEEWIIQTQSIKYSYSTDRAGAAPASAMRDVHKSANVDKRYHTTTAPPTVTDPNNSTQRNTRAKEEVSGRAPVILPTLAKYHLDKIERYKKCVAEKQLRDARRSQQDCCSRPSTAPDPYNILNIYTERCASKKHSKPPATQKPSEPAHTWEVDERREANKPTVTCQPCSTRAPTTNTDESCRAMSAESIPFRNQLLQSSRASEMHRPREKSINLRRETRGATEPCHEQSRSERNSDVRNRTTSRKWSVNGVGDDQTSCNALQEIPANTDAVSKKTKFMDHWPCLDQQIEAFIQAHILQCCILFKNIPPVFPTLDYQEEIQRIYGGHPLSTR